MEEVKIKVDHKAKQLKGLLFALQSYLEEYKEDVDRSYALHEIGEKTELTSELEKIIEQPLEHLYNTSKRIDNHLMSILNSITSKFLNDNSSLINEVYLVLSENVSHFCIILREDSENNRDLLFKFLDVYEGEKISKKFPIVFNFISSEMINSLVSAKKIELNAEPPKSSRS